MFINNAFGHVAQLVQSKRDNSRSQSVPASNAVIGRVFIAQKIHELQAIGARQYAPIVVEIIATDCHDIQHIEKTLDGLLDLACHPDGLKLFKALCRYYYFLDPVATADYVWAYREMWDEDKIK